MALNFILWQWENKMKSVYKMLFLPKGACKKPKVPGKSLCSGYNLLVKDYKCLFVLMHPHFVFCY